MNLSRIVFYETFARFKVAVVIQQIYFRYFKGQTNDERFRNFDQLVLDLAREALELAQRSGIAKGGRGETKSGGKPAFPTLETS